LHEFSHVKDEVEGRLEEMEKIDKQRGYITLTGSATSSNNYYNVQTEVYARLAEIKHIVESYANVRLDTRDELVALDTSDNEKLLTSLASLKDFEELGIERLSYAYTHLDKENRAMFDEVLSKFREKVKEDKKKHGIRDDRVSLPAPVPPQTPPTPKSGTSPNALKKKAESMALAYPKWSGVKIANTLGTSARSAGISKDTVRSWVYAVRKQTKNAAKKSDGKKKSAKKPTGKSSKKNAKKTSGRKKKTKTK
jgi:hypothetical protein